MVTLTDKLADARLAFIDAQRAYEPYAQHSETVDSLKLKEQLEIARVIYYKLRKRYVKLARKEATTPLVDA